MINLKNSMTVWALLCAPLYLYATPNEDLLAAAHSGDLAKAKAALKAGANPNTRGFAETPPLISAAINGHTEIVKLLIGVKADIHAKNLARMSALDYAQMHKQTGVINLLVNAGARATPGPAEPRTAGRVAPTNADSSGTKHKSTGFKQVDRFLEGCRPLFVKKGQIEAEICSKIAECIVQAIYKDPLVCTARNCETYQRRISEKHIDSCRSRYAVEFASKSLAEQLAAWAWTQRPTDAAPSASSANPGRPTYQPNASPPAYDYHKENRDFNRYKNCLNSGQRGCQ